MREEPILYSPPGRQIPGVVVPTSADKTESDSGKLASKTRAMRREPPSSLKIPPEREIQGIVVPSSLITKPRKSTLPTRSKRKLVQPRLPESPQANVSRFSVTLVKEPATLEIFDSGVPDGDIVEIRLNNTSLGRFNLPSDTNSREIKLSTGAGVNRIEISAISEGTASPTTLGIRFKEDQVVQKDTFARSQSLKRGQSFVFTAGYPQIALCFTTVRFPCVGQGPTPFSGQHVLEARGNPPAPITAKVKKGQTGNPLRSSYPKLLTNDTNMANAIQRRGDSIKAYDTCPQSPLGQKQDRDEYPPAKFFENRGSAHIKCIPAGDNRRAGKVFQLQLDNYRIDPGGPSYEVGQGDVVEFVILR
jgi:hypothetical protein